MPPCRRQTRGLGTRAGIRDTTGDRQFGVVSRAHPEMSPMSSASRAAALSLVFAALVLLPPPAAAQMPAVPVGAHLRIRGSGAHSATFTGRLRAMSNDSIALALDDDAEQTVPFRVGDIGQLEMEHDEHTRDMAASVMGGIGAAGGIVTAVLWCKNNLDDCDDEIQKIQDAHDNDEDYLGIPGLFVVGGSLLGALVGYVLAPPPHWELVVFPSRTSTLNGSPRMLLNVGVSFSLGGRVSRGR